MTLFLMVQTLIQFTQGIIKENVQRLPWRRMIESFGLMWEDTLPISNLRYKEDNYDDEK